MNTLVLARSMGRRFAEGLVACLMIAGGVLGAEVAPRPLPPVFAPIQDVEGLPRVLLIGDSISIGYTLGVRELLQGKANVHRIPTNGGPTTNGLARIDAWLGDQHWDVIHFNWGLHDLRMMQDGRHLVPRKDYESNLRQLVDRLKKTGATLIWASTTPVPEGDLRPLRKPGDDRAYNAIAAKVMIENGIRINDLYGFALPRLKEIQQSANVHFSDRGSALLAAEVAAQIEKVLPGHP